jgi:phytoene dehydrogenase-like protein
MSFDCIVIGAGLAGITAARQVQRAGNSVLLIEASDQVGGRVRSDVVDGFICDRGFQVINPKYPQVAKSGVVKDLDFKYISGKIRLKDEDIKVGYTLSTFSPKLGSISQKLSFLKFLASSNIKNEESFGNYVKDFSDLYQIALKPFLSGVFLTDPREIAADVAQEILRSFVKSLPAVPASGVGKFSQALAKPIQNIKLNERVQSLTNGQVITNHGSYKSRYVIVATDPTTAAQLLAGLNLPKMLASTTVYFATDQLPADGKNLVVSNNSKLVNSIFISQVSSKYAPAGKHLVSATSLSPITETVFRKELADIWQANTHAWEYVARYEIKQSLPAHLPRVKKIKSAKFSDWIYVAGDHMAVPSQQGAMQSGFLAASAINQLIQ